MTKKLISWLLAVLMLCGTLTCFSITVSAAETTTDTGTAEADDIDYLTKVFATPEEKLATMKLYTTKGNYQIYADEKSGEVAVKDLTSGQILSSNPYDVAATNATDSVKKELLSQIVVRYSENGRPKEYYSYEYAAERDQIKVKNIKNGIRVEYTIGREEARRLVPRMIEQSRFEELIMAPVLEYYNNDPTDFYFRQFMAYFQFKSLDDCSSDRLKADLLAVYPVVNKMNIYVFDPTATVVEIEKREEIIKTACPNYSYEEMDYDHQLTEYESTEDNPPVFKMALEYTLEEDGFTVRLPANGIRFNESKFQLESICVLPYMGAGNNSYEGYTFFPDGSGALFAFEDLVDVTSNSVSSKVYGIDYAYHKISGTYQQTVRYPVFGIVEKTEYYDFEKFDESLGEAVITRINGMIYDTVQDYRLNGTKISTSLTKYASLFADSSEPVEEIVNRGFVAIIEEGDAMAEIATVHEGVKHPYDSVQMSFYPRPQDTYNMADAISVGTATDWTVVSTRKYVGNYKIHYVMLTDSNLAAEKQIPADKWYDATWMGMAMAYRDYLIDKGVLTALTAEQTAGDIPLYIEAFGSIETVEKYFSIPVEVKKPLTSFEDVQTMYAEFLASGVTNINFKLTGYANGGMYSKANYKLKWEKSVSKEVSFQELMDFAALANEGKYDELIAFAKEQELFETEEELKAFEEYVATLQDSNLGIYPDFDFSYVWSFEDTLFDGLSLRKHTSRTIDDRAAQKRIYWATRQKYMNYYQLAVSPAYFSRFYEKLVSNYLKYDNVTGISVGSFGNSLNSDFDEDEPYNREDSKSFVKKALNFLTAEDKSNLEVMVDGGNAYTWEYVSHILGASLDSSRYIRASYSVPFLGVVLHGYTNFTGTPLNMEGDMNYAKLKAIENGAAVYFTLSYQNTQTLKEDQLLSQYYSIRYDIWFDDVVEIYNELNTEMKDLQDKIIVDHEFLTGMRVPDTDELYTDILNDFNAVLDFQNNKAEYEAKLEKEAVADARDKIASTMTAAEAFIQLCLTNYSTIDGAAYIYVTGDRSFERRYATFVEADNALKAVQAAYDAAETPEAKKELTSTLEAAQKTWKDARGQLNTYVRNISKIIKATENAYANLTKLLEDAESGALLINSTEGIPESILDEIKIQLEETKNTMEKTLGVKFDVTVDKAEVDTFLHTHASYLVFSAYGKIGATTVGKMERLFAMVSTGDYGLLMSEIDLLRYLEANRELTDDQIIEKYGLSADKSSIEGMVLYLTELLGDSYEFDPIVSADTEIIDGFNAVERNLLDYSKSVLFTRILGLSDSAVIPSMNFVPTRVNDKGNTVSNEKNIKAVVAKIDKAINDAILNKDGVLSQIVDGNYNLDDYFTADQMAALIDEIADTIKKANPASDNPVEYATPDTLRADAEAYIRAKYYQAALKALIPSVESVSIHVMKVNSKTDTTFENLINYLTGKYGKSTGTDYATIVANMENDPMVQAVLTKMADMLAENYGDVSEALENTFVQMLCEEILASKAPTINFISELKASEKKEIMAQIDTIIAERLDSDGVEVVIAAVAQVVEEYAQYLKNPENKDVEISDYVYYVYLSGLVDIKTDSFYYNAEIGYADASIRAHVKALYDQLIAGLSEDATVYDVYNVVLAAMTSDEYDIKGFTAELASGISYEAKKDKNLATDLLDYYVYILLNSFEGYEIGAEAPDITSMRKPDKETGELVAITGETKKNALDQVNKTMKNAISELIADIKLNTKRGALPNYALLESMTQEELATFIDEKVTTPMIKAQFAAEEDRAWMNEEFTELFQYNYYTEVLKQLNASKKPDINVEEIYSGDLYTAAQGIKGLLRYYVTKLSAVLSDEEIDAMLGGSSSISKEEEESISKYISDDGRIVAVTYGAANGDGTYADYRTFVLNYNNFSVSVVYEDITYTIPAYGYVVINY